MPSKLDWSNLEKDYKKLGTIEKVAEKYGCRKETVSLWKKKLGILSNLDNYHRYRINTDFLKKWTSELAYFIGFTAADGNLMPYKKGNSRGGGVRWEIKEDDEELLKKFKKLLKSEHPIVRYKRYNSCGLRIYNKEIYDFFIFLDIKPNKTFNLRPIRKIPQHLLNHFVRGYFDGDGWISYNKNKAQRCYASGITCASKDFLDWISKIIPTKGGSLFKRENYYTLSYGRLDTLRLGEFIYKDSNICLNRKYKRFKLAGVKI